MAKLRVFIVDDSAVFRGYLRKIVDSRPDMEVVGVAPDPLVALDLIEQTRPDVLTLDVEMPRMSGLEFLEQLMRRRPLPVVMVSNQTEAGSGVTLRALELGAVECISKPRAGTGEAAVDFGHELAEKIRAAARARVRRHSAVAELVADPGPLAGFAPPLCEKIVCIGASTGGTEALKEVLRRMPGNSPAVLIAQHMPETFTRSFAERLDQLSAMSVQEARHNERIQAGHAYIAPGHSHLLVKQSGAGYLTELSQAEPVNRHRPSVDVLFTSAAKVLGHNAVAVLLTGMGKDGAAGLLEMRKAGAHTIAQDEASCVVYGMPKAAVDLGAAAEVVPLGEIATRILEALR